MPIPRPARSLQPLAVSSVALAATLVALLAAGCAHQSAHRSSVTPGVSEGKDGLLREFRPASAAAERPALASSRAPGQASTHAGGVVIERGPQTTAAYVDDGARAERRPLYASASPAVASAPEPRREPQAQDVATMTVRVFGAPRCDVDVSGSSLGPAPVTNIEVLPGTHSVEVRCGRKADARSIELSSGEHQELVFDFGTPAPRSKPKAKRGLKRRRRR